jgi:hypothetical protein
VILQQQETIVSVLKVGNLTLRFALAKAQRSVAKKEQRFELKIFTQEKPWSKEVHRDTKTNSMNLNQEYIKTFPATQLRKQFLKVKYLSTTILGQN